MNLEKIAHFPGSVLIQGPPGIGKSSLAKKLHRLSGLSHLSFSSIDLVSLDENLFLSELFGHEKGSFTGANNTKLGLIESANHGTIFLDEIGELGLAAQKKLLKLIETKTYKSIGSTKDKVFNGRFIFATNKDLESLVLKEKFRADLYDRMRSFPLILNPLSHNLIKLEKKLLLIWDFYKKKYHKEELTLSKKQFDYLLSYQWPGNYREMHNFFNYLAYVCDTENVLDEYIFSFISPSKIKHHDLVDKQSGYKQQVSNFEIKLITNALVQNAGKINQTARYLKIPKSTFLSKINRFSINTNAIYQ